MSPPSRFWPAAGWEAHCSPDHWYGLTAQKGNNTFSTPCRNVPECVSAYREQSRACTCSLFSSWAALGSLGRKAKVIFVLAVTR